MGRKERLDVLRSLGRSAVSRAVSAVSRTAPVSALRGAVDAIVHQRSRLDEARLTSAVAHTAGVVSATVLARDGAIAIDSSFDDGTHVAASLVPTHVRFAPRGAKEVSFTVAPAEMATSGKVADVVGAIAAEIAVVLWNMPTRAKARHAAGHVIVDRDGTSLRVDLRTTPAARAIKNTPLEALTEVFELKAMAVRDQALYLDVALPRRP